MESYLKKSHPFTLFGSKGQASPSGSGAWIDWPESSSVPKSFLELSDIYQMLLLFSHDSPYPGEIFIIYHVIAEIFCSDNQRFSDYFASEPHFLSKQFIEKAKLMGKTGDQVICRGQGHFMPRRCSVVMTAEVLGGTIVLGVLNQ